MSHSHQTHYSAKTHQLQKVKSAQISVMSGGGMAAGGVTVSTFVGSLLPPSSPVDLPRNVPLLPSFCLLQSRSSRSIRTRRVSKSSASPRSGDVSGLLSSPLSLAVNRQSGAGKTRLRPSVVVSSLQRSRRRDRIIKIQE